MQSRSLRGEQIDQLYQEHLCRDFPPDERKPLAQIHRAVDRGIYRVVGFYREDTLCGYALLSVLPGRRFGFLDYFAVVPQMRGGGIGGQLLADLRRQMADLQGIFFEVEQPQSAPDPQQAGRHTLLSAGRLPLHRCIHPAVWGKLLHFIPALCRRCRRRDASCRGGGKLPGDGRPRPIRPKSGDMATGAAGRRALHTAVKIAKKPCRQAHLPTGPF